MRGDRFIKSVVGVQSAEAMAFRINLLCSAAIGSVLSLEDLRVRYWASNMAAARKRSSALLALRAASGLWMILEQRLSSARSLSKLGLFLLRKFSPPGAR